MRVRTVALAGALALAVGCRAGQSGGEGDSHLGGNVITVQDTVNYRVSPTLEIGAGNFWPEEYTDQSNQKRQGMTAGLWILSPKSAPGREHVRVHEGQELTAGDQRMKVLEIKKLPLERAYVKLEILP